MKYFCIGIIKLYQRFVSPNKGFKCAHHVLHHRETCSNAVKSLIVSQGLFRAIPSIRVRFRECRAANEYLKSARGFPQTADLPCAMPCDVAIGDCGLSAGGDSTSACVNYCGLPFDLASMSKKTRHALTVGVLVLLLVMSYLFYGRDISTVYVTDYGEQGQNILKRLAQRDQPKVRVLIIADGEKYYSNIVEFSNKDIEYKFVLEGSPASFHIDTLQILDARVNLANELVVVGQIIEEFDEPKKTDRGERFGYRIKRRWHF